MPSSHGIQKKKQKKKLGEIIGGGIFGLKHAINQSGRE